MTLPVSTPIAPKQGVAISTATPAGSLFTASDGDGDAITQYQFWDNRNGGGYFTVSGVQQGAIAQISVAAADLGTVEYVGAGVVGSEDLYVRVLAGGQLSDWQGWQMYTLRGTNNESVITAPAVKNAQVDQWVSLSSFISVSDADADAMWRFELRETGANTASNSGYMFANGAIQPQGASVTVESASLADTYVRGGAVFGTDTYELRVFDGYEWTDWTSFNVVTRGPNHAPVAAATQAQQGVVIGSSVPAGSLFGYTDADADPAIKYEFWDNKAGGGHWDVNGVDQAPFTAISVNAGQLGTVSYEAGAVAGIEDLYVRAYDGEAWSEWAPWLEQTLRATNAVSVINAPAVKNVLVNQGVKVSDFITVTDADSDPIVRFELKDMNGAAGSSLMYVDAVVQPQGSTASAELHTLTNTYVQGATAVGGVNEFQLRVFDGYAWTGWTSFNVVTRNPNHAPVTAATQAQQGVVVGNSVAAGSLFGYTDADADPAIKYEFWDNKAGGGHWDVNGVDQAPFTAISVNAGQLGTVSYEAGAVAGIEDLYVRAYDGEAWSEWAPWLEQTLRATNAVSVINAPAVKNVLVNQGVKVSDFITVTDADSDPIVRFELKDMNGAAGSSLMYVDAVVQPQGSTASAELHTLTNTYVQGATAVGGVNEFQLRVFDGYAWTGWTSFNVVTRNPNHAPVTAATQAQQGVVVGNSVAAGSLFGYTDADADPAIKYEFWDNKAGGGHWDVNGVDQAPFTAISVNAGQLGTVSYEAGAVAGIEDLYVRAYDGEAWSEWAPWLEQTLRATNAVSVINAPAVKNVLVNQGVKVSDFITVTDADSDPIVRFELKDMNGAAGSSLMYVDAVVQPQGSTASAELHTLTNTYVQGATAVGGVNEFQLRVFDGYAWTGWTSFNVVTRNPNHAPVTAATQAQQGVVVGNSVAAGSLFGYTDADADPAIKYEFWDNKAGGGHWDVNGVDQAPFTAISVNAGQLGTVSYEAGAVAGIEDLYVRAYDGEAWSEWAPWLEQTLRATNTASVINAPAVKNAEQNQYWKLSDFISVSDADSDPIVRFELRETSFNTAANSGFIYANDAPQLQGASVSVERNTLATTYVRGGADNGTDKYELRVFDGYEWSDWKGFDVLTRLPNRLPAVTASTLVKYVPTSPDGGTLPGQVVKLSDVYTASDADGDALTYELWDNSFGGGRLYVDGMAQNVQQAIPVTAAQFAQATYVGAGTAGDDIYVRANDGTGFSEWKQVWMYNFEGLPEVRGTALPNNFGSSGNNIIFGIGGDDTLTDGFDDSVLMGGQGNDTYNKFDTNSYTVIYENGNSSNDTLHMKLLGGAVGAFIIDSRHLVLLDFDPRFPISDSNSFGASVLIDWKASTHQIENFQFESVFGGPSQFLTYADMLARTAAAQSVGWSDIGEDPVRWNGAIPYYAAHEIELRANQAPVLSAAFTGGFPIVRNQNYDMQPRIQVTEPDQDPIVSYEFVNTSTGNGFLRYNGVAQANGTPFVVPTADLGLITYHSSTTLSSDVVTVRASDGQLWSAPLTLTMSPENQMPTFILGNAHVRENTDKALADFLTAVDPDGDAITQYELYDPSVGGGTLLVNGNALATNEHVLLADISTVTFRAGPATNGTFSFDNVLIRAQDSFGLWGSFHQIRVDIVPNNLPNTGVFFGHETQTVRFPATPEGVNGSVSMFPTAVNAGPDGFHVFEADGDPIVAYRIIDNGIGGGHLEVNGVVQAENTLITLTPQQLQNTYYVAGSSPGSETVSLSASDDGVLYGTTGTMTLATAANIRPVVSGTDVSATSGAEWTLFDRFTFTNDDDGTGKITQYEIRLPNALSYVGDWTQFTPGDPKVYRADRASFFTSVLSTDGAAGGDYTVSMRMTDSVDWSDWEDIAIHLTPAGSPDLPLEITLGSSPQTFNDSVNYAVDSQDIYHFTLASSANFSLQLGGITSTSTVQVLLASDDGTPAPGTPIAPFAGVGAAGLSTSMLLAPGSYNLRIAAPAFEQTLYSLTLSAS